MKGRHTRLSKVFVDIRAGIEHMADKLESVKLDQPSVPISDDTIVDVMGQCDSKLLKMFAAVGEVGDGGAADAAMSMASPRDGLASRGSTRGSARELHPAEQGGAANYNVRVALDDYDDDDDDDDELEVAEADVLGREQMKKNHMGMLDKATSKGKRKGKKGTGGGAAGKTSPAGGKAVGAPSRGRRGELE